MKSKTCKSKRTYDSMNNDHCKYMPNLQFLSIEMPKQSRQHTSQNSSDRNHGIWRITLKNRPKEIRQKPADRS